MRSGIRKSFEKIEGIINSNMMDNYQKLVHCFVESLGISQDMVTDGLAYNTIPEWDSTAHMALVATLEAEFDIMLDTDDIIAMSSVAEARKILGKYGVEFDAA